MDASSRSPLVCLTPRTAQGVRLAGENLGHGADPILTGKRYQHVIGQNTCVQKLEGAVFGRFDRSDVIGKTSIAWCDNAVDQTQAFDCATCHCFTSEQLTAP